MKKKKIVQPYNVTNPEVEIIAYSSLSLSS